MLKLHLVNQNLKANETLIAKELKEIILSAKGSVEIIPPLSSTPQEFDLWAINLYNNYLYRMCDLSTSFDSAAGHYVVFTYKNHKKAQQKVKPTPKKYVMSGKPRKRRPSCFTGIDPEIIKHLQEQQNQGTSLRGLAALFVALTGKDISVQGIANNLRNYVG